MEIMKKIKDAGLTAKMRGCVERIQDFQTLSSDLRVIDEATTLLNEFDTYHKELGEKLDFHEAVRFLDELKTYHEELGEKLDSYP